MEKVSMQLKLCKKTIYEFRMWCKLNRLPYEDVLIMLLDDFIQKQTKLTPEEQQKLIDDINKYVKNI